MVVQPSVPPPPRSLRSCHPHRSLPDLSQLSFESAVTTIEAEPLISQPGPSWTKQTTLLPPKERTCSRVSLASSSSAICRICHLEATSGRDPLTSPCRCSGSLLYVHRSCLVHWLELSTRKMVPSPRCELCGYLYRRGGVIDIRGVHWPRLHLRDRLLNALFVVAFSVMILCAVMSLHFLRVSEQYHTSIRNYQRAVPTSLTNDDVTVIICSVLFFSAFFVAVFTQYRAEASIFRLCFRFWVINRNWTIRNYNILDDPEMLAVRQARGQLVVRRPSPKRASKTRLLQT